MNGISIGRIVEIVGEESQEKLDEIVAEELKKILPDSTPICKITLVKKPVGEVK